MAASDWYTWATSIKNTTKHITGSCWKRGVGCYKMANSSGKRRRIQNTFISFCPDHTAALRVDENTSNVLMEAAVHKVPLSSVPRILGMTSMSVEAVLVHTWAIGRNIPNMPSQLVNPGALCHLFNMRSMDMKTMCINMSHWRVMSWRLACHRWGLHGSAYENAGQSAWRQGTGCTGRIWDQHGRFLQEYWAVTSSSPCSLTWTL